MSPTSYQLLYPAIYALPQRNIWCRRPESNRHVLLEHRILSPGRLPIPPLRHGWYGPQTLIYDTIVYVPCQGKIPPAPPSPPASFRPCRHTMKGNPVCREEAPLWRTKPSPPARGTPGATWTTSFSPPSPAPSPASAEAGTSHFSFTNLQRLDIIAPRLLRRTPLPSRAEAAEI